MALTRSFYQDITEKEEMWIKNIEKNLLNIYYLPELKNFYINIKERFKYEFELTNNAIMKIFSNSIDNLINKIDSLLKEYEEDKVIDLNELKSLFFTNIITNNIESFVYSNLNRIDDEKSQLYELRGKVINEISGDYLEDDFFYESQKNI